jgi:hypothetical protein
MSRLLVLCLCAAPALLACAEQDPPPHFMDVTYQVRCVDCQPLSMDDKTRRVLAIDGENNFEVGCTANGSGPLLSFSATHTDKDNKDNNYSIQVLQASLASRDPGKSCEVRVTEGSNSYSGKCTEDAPTEDSPCQVKFHRDDQNVTGSIFCKRIPNRNTAELTRWVVKPGTTKPFTFQVDGCEGL